MTFNTENKKDFNDKEEEKFEDIMSEFEEIKRVPNKAVKDSGNLGIEIDYKNLFKIENIVKMTWFMNL